MWFQLHVHAQYHQQPVDALHALTLCVCLPEAKQICPITICVIKSGPEWWGASEWVGKPPGEWSFVWFRQHPLFLRWQRNSLLGLRETKDTQQRSTGATMRPKEGGHVFVVRGWLWTPTTTRKKKMKRANTKKNPVFLCAETKETYR